MQCSEDEIKVFTTTIRDLTEIIQLLLEKIPEE